MKTQTFLKIKSPCQENWNKMSNNGDGRFCGSCKQTVVDFSVMTDAQIINYLSTANANTCGRFAADQVSRNLVPNKKIVKKNWQWLLAAITGLFFSTERTWAANIYTQVSSIGTVSLIKQYQLDDTCLTPVIQNNEKLNIELNSGIVVGPTVMGKLEIFGKLDVEKNIRIVAKKMLGQDLFTVKMDKKQLFIQPRYAGNYHVQLYNADSKLLMQSRINANKDKELIVLAMENFVEKGNYYIRLVNTEDSKKEAVKKVSL